jgi:hypothetical protein
MANMKTLILTLVTIIGVGGIARAQSTDTIALKPGQHKTTARSHLKIKFLSVVEDSRCPTDVDCIWAGNAKIKIQVTGLRSGPKTFELNTTMGPNGGQCDGWAINLESLTPAPKSGQTVNPKNYRAKFTIVRLQR